jgi:NADPH2:quinone reductase
MRVVQFDEYGPPNVLHLADIDAPIAGQGQVQIRVAATGVNPADFKLRSGSLQAIAPVRMPHIVGYDAAGVVAAVGPGVERLKVGDRVVATVAAGYAEFVVADESACALLPVDCDFVQAAALPCPALTGVQMIEDGVRPQKGQTVLITGATGGVGRFAVDAALALGAIVVAAVRPSYFDEALQLGAHEVIALEAGVEEGRTFDHVADTIGGTAVARLCRHVVPGGTIFTVSTSSIDPDGLPTPPVFFIYRSDGARLARIVDSVADGAVRMPIARVLPLASAAEGHRLLEAGGLNGRIVLEI